MSQKVKGQKVTNPKALKENKALAEPKPERILKALRITIDRAVAFGELAGRERALNKKTEQELADEAIDLLLKKYNVVK